LQFLEEAEVVRVEEAGEGGMTWLEIRSVFEQRTGRIMPRRWPQDKTLEEILKEKGAAIQDHIKAFARGVKEVLRWAFVQRKTKKCGSRRGERDPGWQAWGLSRPRRP
jgi:hypothetical protein